MSKYHVLGLKLTDGRISPLAWCRNTVSKKEIRRACRKFRPHDDVIEGVSIPWNRLYGKVRDMKMELPRF